MSPNFNQVVANEFAFKRDNAWPIPVLRCSIPSPPHGWDHLTLLCNSVLPQVPGLKSTWGYLGLNSIIICPQYMCWPQYSASFKHLTESQSITQVLIVELQTWSLLMNPCPRICSTDHPRTLSKDLVQHLGLKYNTSPRLSLGLSVHLSIILWVTAAVLFTHWDILLHLGPCFAAVDFLGWWSETVVPCTGQTASSLLVCGPVIWVQSYPQGRVRFKSSSSLHSPFCCW